MDISGNSPGSAASAKHKPYTLNIFRRLVSEPQLALLRIAYGRLEEQLPAPVATFLHKLLYRAGILER